MQERNIVNFRKGKARVEVIIPREEIDNSRYYRQRLKRAIVNTIISGADRRSVLDIARNPSHTLQNGSSPVLSDQVLTRQGKVVSAENAAEFAQSLVNRKNIEKMTIGEPYYKEGRLTMEKATHSSDRGFELKQAVCVKPSSSEQTGRLVKNRANRNGGIIASIEFKLASDHLERRARKYAPIAKREAEKRGFQTELILALMEAESSFNPTARSPIPAFGLMQVVPTTGGRDVYRLVYNKDKVPTDELLYKPDENVMLGTAYFYKIYNYYLDAVQNPRSKLWCSIAAYNIGYSKVLDIFAGECTSSENSTCADWKERALNKLNSKSPEEVYNYLRNNLPYQETRNYVRKVRNSTSRYSGG